MPLVENTQPLLEGDEHVLDALLLRKPGLVQIDPAGGMAGVTAAAFHAAGELYTLHPERPINCIGLSVGAANALAKMVGQTMSLSQAYYEYFCCDAFMQAGWRAAWNRTAFSHEYYGSTVQDLFRSYGVAHAESRLTIGLTNYETGAAEVVTCDCDDLASVWPYVVASGLLPLGKQCSLTIDGVPYCEGAVSNPLPIAEALRQKPSHILIVVPHDEELCRRQPGALEWFYLRHRQKMPRALVRAFLERNDIFNAQLAWIRSQLRLPLDDPRRELPPTLIVWPPFVVHPCEQNELTVRQAHWQTMRLWKPLFQKRQLLLRIRMGAAALTSTT